MTRQNKFMTQALNIMTRCLCAMTLVCASIFILNCGGAEDSGTSSPPVDIPAPVSHLSISTPDADGISRVSAKAGFADAGTTVSVYNYGATTSSSVSAFRARLTITAEAGFQESEETEESGQSSATPIATATTTSATDGSFATSITAAANDTITVTCTISGALTTFTTSVPATNFAIPDESDLLDIAVDGYESRAVVLGNDGTDGYIYIIDLTTGALVDSYLRPASVPTRVAVDATTGYFATIDTANEEVQEINPSLGVETATASVPDPADIAYGASGNFAIITHSTGSSAASYYDSLSVAATSLTGVAVESGATHQTSPFVDTDWDGTTDVFATLSLMSDGVFYAVLFEVEDALTASQRTVVALSELGSPGGIALFDAGNQALVSDSQNDRVYAVNFNAGSVSAIAVGDDPRGVTVDSANNLAYVANNADDTVSVILLSSFAVTATVNVGLEPVAVSVDNSGVSFTSAAVLNTGSATVTVIAP